MKAYKSRNSKDYLRVLCKSLLLDGEDGLLSQALKMREPIERDGLKYTHCATVDYCGLAGTTLFDIGGNYGGGEPARLVEKIFERVKDLNERNILLKFRVLLVYPYSTYAFSVIQAESTDRRSSIEEPRYTRDFELIDSVDTTTFQRSHFVLAQATVLNQIQYLLERYGLNETSVNRIRIRFLPNSPESCILRVNNCIFYDPYLLAKVRRTANACAHLSPVVKVTSQDDKLSYDVLIDHFRYLWDLEHTLHMNDATSYDRGIPKSLSIIREPKNVSFDGKVSSILARYGGSRDDKTDKWKKRMEKVLQQYCREPKPVPGDDQLFLTCSWALEDGQRTPNKYAAELSTLLEGHIGALSSHRYVKVKIMEGVPGDFFSQELYKELNESNLAVILLTNDIHDASGRGFSKPNVYHELGYLMKHLGSRHVIVLAETGVEKPTNIQNSIFVELQKDKLLLAYPSVLDWACRRLAIGAHAMAEISEKVCRSIDDAVLLSKITVREGVKAKAQVVSKFK